MNGSLIFWDWKRSKKMVTIGGVDNEETYQEIYFAKKNGDIRGIVFLEDNGYLLEHDLLEKKTMRRMVLPYCEEENWKIHVDRSYNTDKIYAYDHDQAIVRCFESHPY